MNQFLHYKLEAIFEHANVERDVTRHNLIPKVHCV